MKEEQASGQCLDAKLYISSINKNKSALIEQIHFWIQQQLYDPNS